MLLFEDAARHYRQALTIRERIGELREQGSTHGELAALYLDADQAELAREHCQHALAIHDRTGDDVARRDALTTLEDIQRQLGSRRESVRTAHRAVALSEAIADCLRRGRALTILAHALATAGFSHAADLACAEALTAIQEVADPDARTLRDRLHTIQDAAT